jgi:hypothetical protein
MTPLPTVPDWVFSPLANGAFFLLLGLLAACLGTVRWLGEDRWLRRSAAGDRRWRARLVAWRVQGEDEASDLARQLHVYWYRVNSAIAIAIAAAVAVAGLGQLLATRLGAAGLVNPSRDPFDTSNLPLLYLALVAGTGLGYVAAVRLGRRWGTDGPRYGDLHRRRLADYRRFGWRWLAAALTALPVGLTLASGAAASSWLALVVPAEMVLALVSAELLMAAAAAAPRMVVAAELAVARRCDDLVRANVIWRLQATQLMGLAFGCMLQADVIRSLAGPSGPAARLLLLVVGVLAIVALVIVAANEGRLGGRVTGWAGRPMPE